MKLAEAGMESNNTLGAQIVEEKAGWFYGWADKYDVWNDYSHTSTNENEPSSSHTFMGNNSIFKLTTTKHNGKSKTRIVSEYLHLLSRIFTLANVKNKHGTFEAND